jgi:hypothetical protein
MTELPSFDEAIEAFCRFLNSRGIGGEIAWVFREDVCRGTGGRVGIRSPLAMTNTHLVRRFYEQSRFDSPGIALEVLCSLQGRICAYIIIPGSKREAEEAMISGLKLSAPTDVREAQACTRGVLSFLWNRLAGGVKQDAFMEMIPRRPRRT